MVLANWTIKFWNIQLTLHVFTIQTREMVIMHPGLLFPDKSTQNRLRTLKIGTVSLLLILSCDISLVCIIICDVFFILCILVQNYEIWIAFPFSILFECVWFCWVPFRLVFVWLHFFSFVRMKCLKYISMKRSKNERTGHVNQMNRENRNIQISKNIDTEWF